MQRDPSRYAPPSSVILSDYSVRAEGLHALRAVRLSSNVVGIFAADLEAVLNAAGSEQAAIVAAFDGGPVALNFAATNPGRVGALILWNSYARWFADADHTIGADPSSGQEMLEIVKQVWGTEDLARMISPDDDDNAIRWLARTLRAGSSGSATGAPPAL